MQSATDFAGARIWPQRMWRNSRASSWPRTVSLGLSREMSERSHSANKVRTNPRGSVSLPDGFSGGP